MTEEPRDQQEEEFDAFISKIIDNQNLSMLEEEVIADCILALHESWYKVWARHEMAKLRLIAKEVPKNVVLEES